MSFVIDGLLIVICIIVLRFAVKRGFVRTILSIVSTVAATLLAVVFTPSLSEVFYDSFILNKVVDGIENTVASHAGGGTAEEILAMLQKLPESLTALFERYGIGDAAVAEMTESAVSGSATVQTVSETIASPVASAFASALAFICIFAVAKIVLRIIVAIVDGIFKLPVLNTVNKAAGLALGIVLACVVIFVYSSVADSVVTSLGAISPKLFGGDVVDNTIIVKFFSEHNIFGIIKDVLY